MRRRISCVNCQRTMLTTLESRRHFHRCARPDLHVGLRWARPERPRQKFEVAFDDILGGGV